MGSSSAPAPGITAITGTDFTRADTTAGAIMADPITGGAATTVVAIMGDRATVPTGADLPIVPGPHFAEADHEALPAVTASVAGTASMVEVDSAVAAVVDSAAVAAGSMVEAGFMVAEATAADTAKAAHRV